MTTDDLNNRIKKRFSYLKKWAKREKITCFRVYEKDLPDYPLILDWYDGEAVAWIYDRKRDETETQKDKFNQAVKAAILQALDLAEDRLHLKTRRRQKGTGTQYEKLKRLNIKKVVEESGLKFEVNLADYLDTGLFLDHRDTRSMCRKLAKGKRFLNLFSYTGTFTCYAIDGGAISTTSVDLSASYTKWAERNLALNGFGQRGSDRLISENCLSFIKLEAARNRYDLILCDPPTFSNSKRMKTSFSVDEDYGDLIRSCLKLLSPSGTLIFSTNSRKFKLDPGELPSGLKIEDITEKTIPVDFRNRRIHSCWVIGRTSGVA